MSEIVLEHVTKTYVDADTSAVEDVSLSIESGSFVVLLGPSGCGKTTLLKMINRLFDPTSGTIMIGGKDTRDLEATSLRRRIGYVIQQVGLFPHMTVSQNVAVVPSLLNWSRERREARVRELLDLVELPPDEYCSRYPAQLSGGQQQRVGVARALAGDPDVVLMDEPFGAIDAITRATLQDEMLRLQRKLKKTVVFVTHDVEEALRLADLIVVMRQGRVVQYDTPLRILTEPANDFVRDLVGADDMVRQLSLLRVEQAMKPLRVEAEAADIGNQSTIAFDNNLHDALSLLLYTGNTTLVVKEGREPVGCLPLDDIRASARSGGPG